MTRTKRHKRRRARAKRASWPDEVPVLTAGDMCKGRFERDDGRQRCLLGWLTFVFPVYPEDDAPCDVPLFALQYEVECIAPRVAVQDYMDADETTLDAAARLWNRAMRNLGYDVPKEAC